MSEQLNDDQEKSGHDAQGSGPGGTAVVTRAPENPEGTLHDAAKAAAAGVEENQDPFTDDGKEGE